jgi:hypothetical protein
VFEFKNDLLKRTGLWFGASTTIGTHRPMVYGRPGENGMESYYNKDNPSMINHPGTRLKKLSHRQKVGYPSLGLLVIASRFASASPYSGAAGGQQIKLLQKENRTSSSHEVHEWKRRIRQDAQWEHRCL